MLTFTRHKNVKTRSALEPLELLKEKIAARRILVVAGTGVSMACTGDRRSTWKGLLEDGLAYARQYGDKAVTLDGLEADIAGGDTDRLILAAKKITKALGGQQGGLFAEWLRQSVGELRIAPGRSALADALHALDAPLATTNYDDILREGAGRDPITWKQHPAVHRFLLGHENAILHLHGHWKTPESVIFDDRSYSNMVGNQTAQALQQLAAGSRSLLFVGYGAGFEDPNFEQWLDFLRQVLAATGHQHFRLVRSAEYEAARKFHAKDNIVPIAYGDDHEDLPGFLQRLAPAPAPAAISIPAPAAPPPPGGKRLRAPGPCIGRDEQVEAMVQTLLAARPACLLGPGGVGKSTVSLRALHDERVVEKFGERRYFVYCEAANSRNELMQAIARDTGVTPGEHLEARLWQHLERAPAALTLDNFETPWEQDAGAVEELLAQLAALPRLALVASIRGRKRPQDLDWGLHTEIAPLDAAAARAVFLQYAGAALAGDPDLDALVAEQDGLPLALRLLGAQAQGAPNLNLLRRAWEAKRSELLQAGAADHKNLSLAVSAELSVAKLTPAALRLLSLLALLPGGAAEAQLPALLPDDTFAAARDLRQSGLAYDADGRLRLLRPVRDHVLRRHPPEVEDRLRAIEFYCGYAAEAGAPIGGEGGAEAATALAAELDNLETLLPEALAGASVEPGIRAALAIADLLRYTGLGWKGWLEQASGVAPTDELRAKCLKKLGDVAWTQSDNEGARGYFDQALPLYERIGDLLGKANCLSSLGDIAFRESDNEGARGYFDQALPLYERIGSLLGKANCLRSLGDLLKSENDLPGAIEQWQTALGLYRRIGDRYSIGWTLRRLALAHEGEARQQYLDQAREAWRDMPYLWENLEL